MTHLAQLITAYEDDAEIGVTLPATYVADAQRFFQDHGVTLSEPVDQTPPRVDPLSEQPIVRLSPIGLAGPPELQLQSLQNLANKYREYVQRDTSL